MDKNFVLSGNKLITKFMGFKVTTDGISQLYYTEDGSLKQIEKYHKSWNWLMTVVEKIEQMGYMITINTKMCSITRDNKGNNDSYLVKAKFGDQTKIEKLYSCVIAFIKYVNKPNL